MLIFYTGCLAFLSKLFQIIWWHINKMFSSWQPSSFSSNVWLQTYIYFNRISQWWLFVFTHFQRLLSCGASYGKNFEAYFWAIYEANSSDNYRIDLHLSMMNSIIQQKCSVPLNLVTKTDSEINYSFLAKYQTLKQF